MVPLYIFFSPKSRTIWSIWWNILSKYST